MTSELIEPTFGRVITAMVTPFDSGGEVDYSATSDLAKHLTAHGNDALVIAGSTGESVTLTQFEKLRLFETVRKAVGPEKKVLAGVGSPCTRDTVELAKLATDTGVDGLLVVTPAYNRPSQPGLYQHFAAIAGSTDLPIILYNVPSRTAVNLEAETVIRLSEITNVVGLKEAGRLEQAAEVIAGTDSNFVVYCGSDELNFPMLALGAVGVISVIGHVLGDQLQSMHRAFFRGDWDQARCLHLQTLPFTRAMFSVPNPVPTKTALQLLRVLESSHVRLPLIEATDTERLTIHAALKAFGLLN